MTVQTFDGNLTAMEWRQLDPYQDYTQYNVTTFNTSSVRNKFIFSSTDLLTMSNETGYLASPYATQALRTNSFRFTSEIETIRVMARASTFNNFGYEVGEFYTNVIPRANVLLISSND